MFKSLLVLLAVLGTTTLSAQQPVPDPVEGLPYYQIPDYPETVNGPTVLARMIDGLGYRYYWATEGLRAEDLAYEPGNEGQNMERLITHLFGLSETILNTALNQPNIRPLDAVEIPWEAKRAQTLLNLKRAADLFRELPADQLANRELIFQRGERKSRFPIWQTINGPLADAIYHTGQIVAYRRTAGNPIHPEVNVFIGKTGN